MSPATEASLKEVMEILEEDEGTCLWSGEGCTDCRTCEQEGCGCQGPTHRDCCCIKDNDPLAWKENHEKGE